MAAALAAISSISAFALEPASVFPAAENFYLAPAPWADPNAPAVVDAPSALPKAVVATPAINTASRASVRGAFNAYYNLARPQVVFSGYVPGCLPGTISLEFQEWTISRINFLRAMAGVSGNTTLDSSKNDQEQAAALIMAANSSLDHNPPNTSTCYTALGATGANQSNLSLGVIDSIPLYMSEPGAGNEMAGHRRWILHSGKSSFGLGQAELASALYTFNNLGVSGSAPNGIPWPPRGYVPLDIFPSQFISGGQLWSFGLPGANFASANVALTLFGVTVPVVVRSTATGYGDNSIVWQLPANHTVAKGSLYDVTISGIAGAASSTYSYQIRPFDPADPLPSLGTDLNSDGKSDLLYRNSSTGQVYRMLMNGLVSTNGAMAYTEPNLAWKVVGDGDFNGDGVTDLLWRNTSTGLVWVMPFNASGMPVGGGSVTTETNPAWTIVATPDLDGDGRADILWWNSSTGLVWAMRMNGATIVSQGAVYTEPNTAWKIVAVGDFAGSGRMNQLVWRNATTGAVFLMTVEVSGGSFTQTGAMIYQEPNTAWKIIAAADFDGDGKSDLLWRNDATGYVYVMLMNGTVIASQGMVHQEPNLAWKIVSQGDYNGDGKADLLWRNDTTGQVYMMLMNGLAITSQGTVYQEPNTAWKLLGTWEYAK